MTDKIVFVDVDTQKDFMNEGWALYVPEAETIKSNLKEITEIAKASNGDILKTMDTHNSDSEEFTDNGGIFPEHCLQDSHGWLSIEETSFGESLIFEKDCYDVFDLDRGNLEFIDYINILSRFDSLAIVYGVATDYCVKAAVLGLRKRCINVVVLSDCIMGVEEMTTSKAIKEMIDVGAWIWDLKFINKVFPRGISV